MKNIFDYNTSIFTLPGNLRASILKRLGMFFVAVLISVIVAVITAEQTMLLLCVMVIGGLAYFYFTNIHPILKGNIVVLEAVVVDIKDDLRIKNRSFGRTRIYVEYEGQTVMVYPQSKKHGLSVGDHIEIYTRQENIQQGLNDDYFITSYYALGRVV